MRKWIYRLINRLGYNIYKKNVIDQDKIRKLRRFNVSSNFDLVYRCANYIFLLQERYPDLEISDSGSFLNISFNKMTFFIESGEEFIILKEIFLDNEYNFSMDDECVLFDIGANVGMASIFFNQQSNIKKIYSFEPVQDNFQIAEKNLTANKITKVNLFNFGLGNEEREEQFLYSRQLKGNSGNKERNNSNYRYFEGIEERTVKIKKATDVLRPIIEKYRDLEVVVKMDCEGGEYEIMQNLADSNLLQDIDVIMLEWHDKRPGELLEHFKNNNFCIFTRYFSPNAGMMYGIKRK